VSADRRPLWVAELISRISEIYCAFATNDDLEMAQTQQYGESQLMVRAKTLLKASSTQPGLEFLCFPIPEDHDIYEDITFTEDYCFSNDYKQGYIQLGPATLLNVSYPICSQRADSLASLRSQNAKCQAVGSNPRKKGTNQGYRSQEISAFDGQGSPTR